MCFFYSSRRRHTRYWRDWSSDVCSSDLADQAFDPAVDQAALGQRERGGLAAVGLVERLVAAPHHAEVVDGARVALQIGRAPCRGRVESSVGAVTLKKKHDILLDITC